ncbi:MAG: isochorismatase family protein [Bacteroidales bacterium]|jgi:nicotinamidase-related amidase|nr:isochorismatase family protein [Bacteroidales bacterium]MBR2202509.1 isochorismatase family protein [Bacteroidales bacterium]MBR3712481.1 isochorismatase family protein [Bacteroidales bacterium]MBR4272689.1 isochorismatase family protein [Bacteroidales bacterium]
MNNTILLIIDPQNDFCDAKGALYVPNAEKDISNLVNLLDKHGDKIDEVILTADDHIPYDIAHPAFWVDKDGNPPAPFTTITSKDIREGKYSAVAADDLAIATEYIEELESLGKTHTIWPMHCIAGTWGADIYPSLLSKIFDWMQGTNKRYCVVRKGWYPYTEHFGAFEAEVQYPMVELTLFNSPLARVLSGYSQILIAGEAKSHCVNNTIRQMMNKAPELMSKLVILDDAMSPVTGCENLANDTIAQARKMGAQVSSTVAIFK